MLLLNINLIVRPFGTLHHLYMNVKDFGRKKRRIAIIFFILESLFKKTGICILSKKSNPFIR